MAEGLLSDFMSERSLGKSVVKTLLGEFVLEEFGVKALGEFEVETHSWSLPKSRHLMRVSGASLFFET